MTAGRALSLLCLCAMTGIVWWLENMVADAQNEALRRDNNRPDFYMRDFTLFTYDADTGLRYKASGKSMMQYPRDGSMEIEQLDMHAYNKNPLFVRANNAHISDDGNQVTLTGAVSIRQSKPGNGDSFSAKTEKLFMDNQRDYMETNKAITIRTGKRHLRGVGLQAWLELEKYRLLSNTRSVYEP